MRPRGSAAPVDLNKYPADFSLELRPNVDVSNGVNFFTQTGTPVSLNQLLQTYVFPIPAGTTTDVGPSFNGNPIGVYRSFSQQYQTFLGTTRDVNGELSLVVVLAQGVGIGKTFNEVFGNQFAEVEIVDALVLLSGGSTIGVPLLFDFVASSLTKQPLYSPSGPNTFTLAPSELVKFSTGVSAGASALRLLSHPHRGRCPRALGVGLGRPGGRRGSPGLRLASEACRERSPVLEVGWIGGAQPTGATPGSLVGQYRFEVEEGLSRSRLRPLRPPTEQQSR